MLQLLPAYILPSFTSVYCGLVQKAGWVGWVEPGSNHPTLHHLPASAVHHLRPRPDGNIIRWARGPDRGPGAGGRVKMRPPAHMPLLSPGPGRATRMDRGPLGPDQAPFPASSSLFCHSVCEISTAWQWVYNPVGYQVVAADRDFSNSSLVLGTFVPIAPPPKELHWVHVLSA